MRPGEGYVTDLAGSRSKTGTQLSHPHVAGAPPACDAASPGRPETSPFPLAVHVIFVDAGTHIISLPGCRHAPTIPAAQRPPLPRPAPLAASPVVNWVAVASLRWFRALRAAHTSYRSLAAGAAPSTGSGELQPEGGLPTFPAYQAVLQRE